MMVGTHYFFISFSFILLLHTLHLLFHQNGSLIKNFLLTVLQFRHLILSSPSLSLLFSFLHPTIYYPKFSLLRFLTLATVISVSQKPIFIFQIL